MKIKELHLLNQHKHQFNELQKVYFLKCKELADFEEHLKNTKIQIKELLKNSRAKLKNSKKIKI